MGSEAGGRRRRRRRRKQEEKGEWQEEEEKIVQPICEHEKSSMVHALWRYRKSSRKTSQPRTQLYPPLII